MKALVYTGVEELTYRDEKEPTEISGESILKVHASEFVDLICMLTMVKMKKNPAFNTRS